MADNQRNPFGGYNEKNVGRTVQNVTSEMWEPISTGTPVRKDTPVRKSSSAPVKPQTQSKKKTTSSAKKQTKKAADTDVTKDRISEGRKPERKPTEKKTTQKNKAEKKTENKTKKKPPQKSREPKGKDTRNIGPGERSQQRERQRARSLNKSRLEYNEQLKSGRSHDDIRKRTSKKKRKKSKLTALITVVVMLLFVAGFVFAYVYTKGAPIATITIEGESQYKNEKVIEAANVYSGLNMLSVREKTVNELVTKSLPYIRSVEVDYQLPDALLLRITPTAEKLIITNGAGCICIDDQDKVLSLKKKKVTDGMYLVEGFEEQPATEGELFVPSENNLPKYEKIKELLSVLSQTEGFNSGTIEITSLNDIRFIYDSRIKIYLGEAKKADSQLSLAIQVIKDGASEGQTGYIDMRFGDKAYLALGSMEIK